MSDEIALDAVAKLLRRGQTTSGLVWEVGKGFWMRQHEPVKRSGTGAALDDCEAVAPVGLFRLADFWSDQYVTGIDERGGARKEIWVQLTERRAGVFFGWTCLNTDSSSSDRLHRGRRRHQAERHGARDQHRPASVLACWKGIEQVRKGAHHKNIEMWLWHELQPSVCHCSIRGGKWSKR